MPKEYEKHKLECGIIHIRHDEKQGGKKSDWVLVTQRLEINGKSYALSKYLTWMYRDHREDPVEHMREWSIINVIHQDVCLIEDMLKEIGIIFSDIITWKTTDMLSSLKEKIGLLQYLFAHAMPYDRGSEAISEWLESALYRYHGYSLNRKKGKRVNLYAFALDPHQFIQQYPSMITVNKTPAESAIMTDIASHSARKGIPNTEQSN